MTDDTTEPGETEPSRWEVEAVARGIATAVAPSSGITDVQARCCAR
jgi:hypothetical protein